jgi:hypothetical protein
MGRGEPDNALTFQSKHQILSIKRVPVSSISPLSSLESMHPFPTVLWAGVLNEIECSRFKYDSEENNGLPETDEQTALERGTEEEEEEYEDIEKEQKEYELFLISENVNFEALGSGFESKRRGETIDSFRSNIGLSSGVKFSDRPATRQKISNKTYFESDGTENGCTELRLGDGLGGAIFVVGDTPKGLDNYVKPHSEENKFICSLTLFSRVVNLHVLGIGSSHCWSLHHFCQFPPVDQMTVGGLKKLGRADSSWIKYSTVGNANDQIKPCIDACREVQQFLYVFFIHQIRSAKIYSIERRKSKDKNPLFKEGRAGFVIVLHIPMEVSADSSTVSNITLRYAIFVLDLQADENPLENDFIYWELLSVYDVDETNPLSEEEIKTQKNKKK